MEKVNVTKSNNKYIFRLRKEFVYEVYDNIIFTITNQGFITGLDMIKKYSFFKDHIDPSITWRNPNYFRVNTCGPLDDWCILEIMCPEVEIAIYDPKQMSIEKDIYELRKELEKLNKQFENLLNKI